MDENSTGILLAMKFFEVLMDAAMFVKSSLTTASKDVRNNSPKSVVFVADNAFSSNLYILKHFEMRIQ